MIQDAEFSQLSARVDALAEAVARLTENAPPRPSGKVDSRDAIDAESLPVKYAAPVLSADDVQALLPLAGSTRARFAAFLVSHFGYLPVVVNSMIDCAIFRGLLNEGHEQQRLFLTHGPAVKGGAK